MDKDPNKKNLFQKFDELIKTFIPNFNVRAVLYFTVILALGIFIQVWRISGKNVQNNPNAKNQKETVVADDNYWNSQTYKDKIKNQTVNSFTEELQNWLDGKDNEFTKRKFEDILYINNGLTPLTGGDLTTVVPEDFNYLETIAKARYAYAKTSGFVSQNPSLVSLGNLTCDIADKTQKDTNIELYDFRYASMQKLAKFMASKPDWQMKIGSTTFDVSDPNIEDKDLLNLENINNQPAGLFSFLIFRDPKTNKIFLADNQILEDNGVDSKLTLSRISSHWDKQPKLYFKYGYDGCIQISNSPEINYGQSN